MIVEQSTKRRHKSMPKSAWITAGQAAQLLTERFGRPIRPDYVTKLGAMNRVRSQHISSRMVLYNRKDIEQVQIKARGKSADPIQPEILRTEKGEKLPASSSMGQNTESVSKAPNFSSRMLTASEFANQYGIEYDVFKNYIKRGVNGEKFEVTEEPHHKREGYTL